MSDEKQLYGLIYNLYNSRKYKEVIEKSNKYLKLFQNEYDIKVRFMRAKSLRYLNKFEEAIEELIEICLDDRDNSFSKLELFYIYYFLNRYEEALNLLPELYLMENKYVSNHSLAITELVMRKQLGLPASYKKGSKSDYIKSQVVNYDEAKALEHINNHARDEETHDIHSCFNENINIEYLMESVKNNLEFNNKINVIDILEIHYFSISGIGYDNTSLCNFLKVVVVPNTSNIISMYPCSKVEVSDVDVLKCDFDKLFNRQTKEKVMSRIDKFNKKFNL